MNPSQPQDVPLARPVSIVPLPPSAPMARYAGDFNPLLLTGIAPVSALLDAALVFLTTIVVHYLPQVLAILTGQSVELPDVGWSVAAGKWLEATLVLGLLAYFALRQGTPLAAHGLRFDQPARQLGWGMLAWAAIYVYLLATAVLIGWFLFASPGGQQEIQRRIEFAQRLPLDDTPLVVVLLIAVSIHEEVLFRGLLLPLLRRATGRWWAAVAIASGIFGLLHFPQGWVAMLQITGVSLVLCVFFIWSRSILAVILAHFLFDFGQMQLMRLVPHMLDWLKQMPPTQS